LKKLWRVVRNNTNNRLRMTLNSFYINTEHHQEPVEYGFQDAVIHEANNWKTWVPKISDIKVITKLDKDVKVLVRREIHQDILECESEQS